MTAAHQLIATLANRLSIRAANILRRCGIDTLQQLADRTPDSLLSERNCGEYTVNEYRALLRQHGLYLVGEGPPRPPADRRYDLARDVLLVILARPDIDHDELHDRRGIVVSQCFAIADEMIRFSYRPTGEVKI